MPHDEETRSQVAGWLVFDGPVKGPVMDDFLEMYGRMTIYRRFLAVIRRTDPEVLEKGAVFIRWVSKMYGDVQLMALRRQADRGSRDRTNVQSLARMIDVLIELTDDGTQRAEMEAHRQQLQSVTQRAVDRATTTLAHLLDRDTWSESAVEAERVTFIEIHDAIDAARGILAYYEDRLVGTRVALDRFIVPQRVFTVPWIKGTAAQELLREPPPT